MGQLIKLQKKRRRVEIIYHGPRASRYLLGPPENLDPRAVPVYSDRVEALSSEHKQHHENEELQEGF